MGLPTNWGQGDLVTAGAGWSPSLLVSRLDRDPSSGPHGNDSGSTSEISQLGWSNGLHFKDQGPEAPSPPVPQPGPELSWQEVSLGFLSLPWSLSDWLLPSSQPSQPWETYGKGALIALIVEALGSRREWERESVCERDLHPKPDQRFPFCCGDAGTCPCRAAGSGDQADKAGVARREPVIRRGNWATGQVSHGLAVIPLTKSSLFRWRTKPPL